MIKDADVSLINLWNKKYDIDQAWTGLWSTQYSTDSQAMYYESDILGRVRDPLFL